eukprot:11445288-Heterocapsa_arctica.AAC.1
MKEARSSAQTSPRPWVSKGKPAPRRRISRCYVSEGLSKRSTSGRVAHSSTTTTKKRDWCPARSTIEEGPAAEHADPGRGRLRMDCQS